MIRPRYRVVFSGRLAGSGFTLLELLLALGLSAVIIGAIAMAVDIHWRVLDAGRREVEEAQLARAILRRMADDIRGAVPYDPQQAEKLLGGVVPSPTDAASLASAAGLGTGEVQSALSAASNEGDSSGSSWVPPSIPALYGTTDVLQVDVSRLPRLDEISSAVGADPLSPLAPHLTDVQSIAYFLVSDSGLSAADRSSTQGNRPRSGLVRRQLDRAVTAWAAEQGTLRDVDAFIEPIAPEVVRLEFSYFDGAQWYSEWDSVSAGGLPKAVEIAIALRRPPKSRGAASWMSATNEQPEESCIYRMLVVLPGAHAPAQSPETTSEEEGETSETDEGLMQSSEDSSADLNSGDTASGNRGRGSRASPASEDAIGGEPDESQQRGSRGRPGSGMGGRGGSFGRAGGRGNGEFGGPRSGPGGSGFGGSGGGGSGNTFGGTGGMGGRGFTPGSGGGGTRGGSFGTGAPATGGGFGGGTR